MDSSALFKCYCREEGAGRAKELLAQPGGVAAASLCYAEVFSALNRKLQERWIDPPGYAAAAREFDRDWKHLTIVPLTFEVLHHTKASSDAGKVWLPLCLLQAEY